MIEYNPIVSLTPDEAHPLYFGALYRTPRALAKEPAVHFVEPTHMVVNNS